MFAEEIRRAAEAAPRVRLHEVSAALWKAFAAGGVSEAEAEEISGLIEARKVVPAAPSPQRISQRVGSRPRTDASMERRRRWASSGRLPSQIAARFTLAEQAVLAVVAAEVTKRGDLRLCHEAVAAIAGVSRSTVRATLRRARVLDLVKIEERRLTPWRSLPSIVRIVSPEWMAWNRLARRPGRPDDPCVETPSPARAPTGPIARRVSRVSQGTSGGRSGKPLGPDRPAAPPAVATAARGIDRSGSLKN